MPHNVKKKHKQYFKFKKVAFVNGAFKVLEPNNSSNFIVK